MKVKATHFLTVRHIVRISQSELKICDDFLM